MSNGRPNGDNKRRIITFEPSGPVASMLDCELRSKPRGARTALLERAIVALLGAKYPKLRRRFDVLADESARRAA